MNLLKEMQAVIREKAVAMDNEEYTAFLLDLADWAQEQAYRTEAADDIDRYLEFE